MVASESHLSDPDAGNASRHYDFVVATTQASINTTMKRYLQKLKNVKLPDICICIIEDKEENPPVQMALTYEQLLVLAKGSDPFGERTSTDKDNLVKVGFVAALKITPGLPTRVRPENLGTIVNLIEGSQEVEFSLLCADIRFVELVGSRRGKWAWFGDSQNAQPGRQWTVKTRAKLDLNLLDRKGGFQKLPQVVKDKIKNLGGDMFSIQQLALDLTPARKPTDLPNLEGVKAGPRVVDMFQKHFISFYVRKLMETGQPILGYIVKHESDRASLKPTAFNFAVPRPINETDPAVKTLNYLCVTGDRTQVPDFSNFGWDWLSANEMDEQQIHGIISINRDTFVRHLCNGLADNVAKNCDVPRAGANWTMTPGSEGLFAGYVQHEASFTSQKPKVVYLEPSETGELQKPTLEPTLHVVFPPIGETLVKMYYYWAAHENSGAAFAPLGHTQLIQYYMFEVKASRNKLTTIVHKANWLSVRDTVATSEAWILNMVHVNEAELGVSQDGDVVITDHSTSEDRSTQPDRPWHNVLFGNMVNVDFDRIKKATEHFLTPLTSPTALNNLKNFIFPGGTTFTFKNCQFSDHQDLVVSIVYSDPVVDKQDNGTASKNRRPAGTIRM